MLVSLQKMWLSDVATGDTFGWYTDDSRDQTFNTRGTVRFYSGGRQRAIGPAGVSGLWKFTLMQMTQAEVETLKIWLSSSALIFARDHRGRASYGKFFDVNVTENKDDGTYRASIELHGIDVIDGGLDDVEVALPAAESPHFNTDAAAENAHTTYDVTATIVGDHLSMTAGYADLQHITWDASRPPVNVTDIGAPDFTVTAFDATIAIDASRSEEH